MQSSGTESLTTTLQNAENGQSKGIIGDMLIEGIKSGHNIDVANVYQFVSDSIATMIISIACMLIIFIAIRILFAIFIKFVIKSIVKLPVLKQIDKVGGIGIGFLEGIIVAYIFIMILNILNLGGIEGQFEKTYVVKYFLDIDLVKATFLTFF
jgi:hypothetical protein